MSYTVINYLVRTFKDLIASFRNLDKRFFLVALYDLLFILSALLIIIGGSALLGGTSLKILQAQPSLAPAIADIQFNVPPYLLAKVIGTLAIWAAITFIGILICQALFKGFMWNTIMSKKLSWSYFKGFFALNLLWFLIWAAASIIIYIGARQPYRLYIQLGYFLLLFHFTTILYIVFTRIHKVKKSIKLAFSLGVRKLGYFIIPYIYAVVIYAVISQLLRLADPATRIGTFITVVVTILFIAWLRLYAYSIAKEIRVQ